MLPPPPALPLACARGSPRRQRQQGLGRPPRLRTAWRRRARCGRRRLGRCRVARRGAFCRRPRMQLGAAAVGLSAVAALAPPAAAKSWCKHGGGRGRHRGRSCCHRHGHSRDRSPGRCCGLSHRGQSRGSCRGTSRCSGCPGSSHSRCRGSRQSRCRGSCPGSHRGHWRGCCRWGVVVRLGQLPPRSDALYRPQHPCSGASLGQ